MSYIEIKRTWKNTLTGESQVNGDEYMKLVDAPFSTWYREMDYGYMSGFLPTYGFSAVCASVPFEIKTNGCIYGFGYGELYNPKEAYTVVKFYKSLEDFDNDYENMVNKIKTDNLGLTFSTLNHVDRKWTIIPYKIIGKELVKTGETKTIIIK